MGSGQGKKQRARASTNAAPRQHGIIADTFGKLDLDTSNYNVDTKKFLKVLGKQGIDAWNEFLPRLVEQHKKVRVYFPVVGGVSWRGASLTGMNLSRCVLGKLDLDYANLRDCLFHNTKAEGTSFRGADMHNAEVIDSSFDHADLTDAILAGTRMERVDFSNAIMVGTHIQGMNMWDDVLLYQASCSKMKIERLKIANSDLAHSDWSGSVAQTLEFNDSRLAGVNFSGLYAGRLVADKCGAYGINFYKADIKEVALVGTGADKSHWRHAKIGSTSAGSFITKSDFRKADFEHAQLTNLRLRSATFPGAIFRDAELRVVDAANEPSEPRNDFVGADFLGAKLQDVVVDVDAPMSEIAIPKALRRKLARNTNTLTTYKITPVGLASPQDLGRVKF